MQVCAWRSEGNIWVLVLTFPPSSGHFLVSTSLEGDLQRGILGLQALVLHCAAFTRVLEIQTQLVRLGQQASLPTAPSAQP